MNKKLFSIKKLIDLIFFIQIEQSLKNYINNVNKLNQIENNNFFEDEIKHVVVREFKTIRRREQHIEQKIRRKAKKLKKIKFMQINVVIEKHRIIILINSNNEINLILYQYVKQIDIRSNMKNLSHCRLSTINESIFMMFIF